VPGRTRSHWSARFANAVGRGSTTIIRAPRFKAFCTSTARASHVAVGLLPHSSTQSVAAKSGVPILWPKLKQVAISLCQLQISVA
jgi:hypothetical protein